MDEEPSDTPPAWYTAGAEARGSETQTAQGRQGALGVLLGLIGRLFSVVLVLGLVFTNGFVVCLLVWAVYRAIT